MGDGDTDPECLSEGKRVGERRESDSVMLPPSVLASDQDHDEAAERAQQARMRDAVRRARLNVTQICLMVLTFLAVMYTLHFAASIVLPMVMAVVTNLMLVAPMRLITHRTHLPKPIVAFLLIASMFGGLAAIGMAVSVPATHWLSQLPEEISLVQSHLAMLRDPLHFLQNTSRRVQQLLGVVPSHETATVSSVATGIMPLGSTLLLGTQAFVGQLFTFLIMLFFLLAQGDSLLRRFVEIMPTFNDKRRTVQIVMHIERNISLYLATITVMNVFVGLANTLQCWVEGMPNPLLWGVVAFALNYIPIIGPFTGMLIYFCVALLTFPSFFQALVPPTIYLCIHLLEGETITPLLLARRFTLNPVLVMASLMFWDWMWGITGAFLSVPMLAVFKIICDHVDYLTPVGHMIGGPGSMHPATGDTERMAGKHS